MAITKAVAEEKLALWLAADTAVSQNQSYSIDGQSYSRADATIIQSRINYWQAIINNLSSTAAGCGPLGGMFTQANFD